MIEEALDIEGTPYARSDIHARGGAGGRAMGEALIRLLEQPRPAPFRMSYADASRSAPRSRRWPAGIRCGRRGFRRHAPKDLALFEKLGYGGCRSASPKRNIRFRTTQLCSTPPSASGSRAFGQLSGGAGFVVALTGEIMTMPGLGKIPAAERITLTPKESSAD